MEVKPAAKPLLTISSLCLRGDSFYAVDSLPDHSLIGEALDDLEDMLLPHRFSERIIVAGDGGIVPSESIYDFHGLVGRIAVGNGHVFTAGVVKPAYIHRASGMRAWLEPDTQSSRIRLMPELLRRRFLIGQHATLWAQDAPDSLTYRQDRGPLLSLWTSLLSDFELIK